MPNRDRTGPEGEGPKTGWGDGPCGGNKPNDDQPTGLGRGLGRRGKGRGGRGRGGWWRGWGRGRGGGGRGRGRGLGFNWPARIDDDQEPDKSEE